MLQGSIPSMLYAMTALEELSVYLSCFSAPKLQRFFCDLRLRFPSLGRGCSQSKFQVTNFFAVRNVVKFSATNVKPIFPREGNIAPNTTREVV